MPGCEDRVLLLGALVDGELDAANVAQAEAHIAHCDGCREEVERLRVIRSLLKTDGVPYQAPDRLHARIAALPELAPQAARAGTVARWLGPALGGALAASLATIALVQPGEGAIDREIISSHVRSLQPGHLMDVQTTNQHVVKPWFNGRIGFSPPVPELADQGFPLAGGRLDTVDGEAAAAIVYRRNLHTVNVFVWAGETGTAHSATRGGFTLREWREGGLSFAAVSDIPPGDLRRFEQLYREHSR